MYHLNEFCNIIAALRKSRSWTQTYLAEQLGVSPQSVSKWECGIGYPDVTLFPVIAQVFAVPIGVLFGERCEGLRNREKEYTLKFPVCRHANIALGNVCRVELIGGSAGECRVDIKGDPVFLEYFTAEEEDGILSVRIKNPSGSEVYWVPYDRQGHTGDNLVQIYAGVPADELGVLVFNYLDLCCSDRINPQGNLEYVCEKQNSTVLT